LKSNTGNFPNHIDIANYAAFLWNFEQNEKG